jgi:hypothetical protein
MDVGTMNVLCVIGKGFEGHKITNGFTDTNPVATVSTTVQRERCVIHMVVYWLVESEVKEGTDVIGCAECKLQRSGLDVVRVRQVKDQADIHEAQ